MLQEIVIPTNTMKKTSWAINVWEECPHSGHQGPTDSPPCLLTMQVSELNHWLCLNLLWRFVGRMENFTGLFQLDLLKFLRWYNSSLHIFQNPECIEFRKT